MGMSVGRVSARSGRSRKIKISGKPTPSSLAVIAASVCLLLSACDERTAFAVILDSPGASTKAELEICGRHIKMTPRETGFTAVMLVDCEGSAAARITLADGSITACENVYVTRDVGLDYEFVVSGGQCSVRMVDRAERSD